MDAFTCLYIVVIHTFFTTGAVIILLFINTIIVIMFTCGLLLINTVIVLVPIHHGAHLDYWLLLNHGLLSQNELVELPSDTKFIGQHYNAVILATLCR